MAYGFKSVIFGFNNTGFMITYVYLWISTFNLTPKSFPNELKLVD